MEQKTKGQIGQKKNMWKQDMWKLTAFVDTFVGTSVDTHVGRFVAPFVGSPRRAETGKWTFVGTLVGHPRGRSRGRFRGPTRGHTRGPTRGVKFRSSRALSLSDKWFHLQDATCRVSQAVDLSTNLGKPKQRAFKTCKPCPSFPCFFWKTARKTTKKTRIFYPCRTPKISGKEGKNAQKNKEILTSKKNKEFQKNKERKDREPAHSL